MVGDAAPPPAVVADAKLVDATKLAQQVAQRIACKPIGEKEVLGFDLGILALI